MRDKLIHLRSGRAGIIRPGHPWIFREQLLKNNPSPASGEIISLIDSNGKFIGRGYYNRLSEIVIRLMTFKDESIDKRFFDERIRMACAKREGLLPDTNALRIVFSESDALPGLIIDQYADTVVFQVLTAGMERLKNMLVASLKDIVHPKYIYEKSDSPYMEIEGLKGVKKWWGSAGKTLVEIFEGKAKFIVDIENGHKTGFYLDQRRSRLAVGAFAKNKKVLDLFSYTGGFSIQAAMGGASTVKGIDIKERWIALAKDNAALNDVSDRVTFKTEDAFEALQNIYKSGEKFDIIIIDPPSFARTKKAARSAAKGYKELNLAAMKALEENGVLATYSCSHNISNDTFSSILKEAACAAGKIFKILKRCRQAQDHPAAGAIPETSYLKGYFLEIKTA